MKSSGGIFDVPARQERVAELEAEIARPDFWNQGESAQELLRERTRLQKVVEDCLAVKQQLEDATVLIEMGEEGDRKSVV